LPSIIAAKGTDLLPVQGHYRMRFMPSYRVMQLMANISGNCRLRRLPQMFGDKRPNRRPTVTVITIFIMAGDLPMAYQINGV
jgi:hypothetical protein